MMARDRELRILLPAHEIPDRSTVSKPKGEYTYTFLRKLQVYPVKKESPKLMDLDGYFLSGASINQITPNTMLHWHVTVEEFFAYVEDGECDDDQ